MTILARGASDFATATVSSVDKPSTMISSWIHEGIRGRTCGRFPASFSVGMTTLTAGIPGSTSPGVKVGESTGESTTVVGDESTGSNATGAAATSVISPIHGCGTFLPSAVCVPSMGANSQAHLPRFSDDAVPLHPADPVHSRPVGAYARGDAMSRFARKLRPNRAEVTHASSAARVQWRKGTNLLMLVTLSRRVTSCPPVRVAGVSRRGQMAVARSLMRQLLA